MTKSALIRFTLCLLVAACGGGGGTSGAGTGNGNGNGGNGAGNPGNGLPAELGEFRVNQVGYLPAEPKVALLLSAGDLQGQTFQVRDADSGVQIYEGPVGRDGGSYASFAHLHELDFTTVQRAGRVVLTQGNRRSLPFAIGHDLYAPLIGTTLQFFQVQRCGATAPHRHGPCHLTDGIASGGARNGNRVDATGGWHDAGDYMKFNATIGTACVFMLATFARHPDRFADDDDDHVPDVLAESRIGLDWLLRTWDNDHQVLYYQVADQNDHGHWRLPEVDDVERPNRPVFACEPGRGANVAGKSAAALALAAFLWGDDQRPFHDAAFAARCRTAAEQIYTFGLAHQAVQPAGDFYPEISWQDDLALAAAELYRLTDSAGYLADARSFAAAAGNAWTLRYADLHALAHCELARLDPSWLPQATGFLQADLDNAVFHMGLEPFHSGIEFFYWGSGMVMLGTALEALYYQDLTGDDRYRELLLAQRDFMLGRNAWGVCFCAGAGSVFPHHPHHQIADLTPGDLLGLWEEGPVTAQVFAQQIAQLHDPDRFAPFQTQAAVYHDDVADYTTNEAGIEPAAMGLALAAWFAR